MGRVVFTPKAEPAIDWSEVEPRLQDISSISNISLAAFAVLANDPILNNPILLASGDRVVSLSSSHHDISQAAIAASTSSNKLTKR